jgi:Zn finger protein HypA/HybF involved in hydrogenase expression
MHEASIAQALVERAEQAARDAGMARIRRMNVEMGAHAGLSRDCLGFALGIVTRGTAADGAEITFSGPGAELDEVEHVHDDRPTDVRLTWIDGE